MFHFYCNKCTHNNSHIPLRFYVPFERCHLVIPISVEVYIPYSSEWESTPVQESNSVRVLRPGTDSVIYWQRFEYAKPFQCLGMKIWVKLLKTRLKYTLTMIHFDIFHCCLKSVRTALYRISSRDSRYDSLWYLNCLPFYPKNNNVIVINHPLID